MTLAYVIVEKVGDEDVVILKCITLNQAMSELEIMENDFPDRQYSILSLDK